MGRVGRLRVADRRRRGASGRVRTALLDAVARTEGLGLTVVGVYDASIFASTSSWVDARGTTSGGPTITLTGSPTLSNGVYTFNGTDQYGRASNGRLGEITGDCWSVVIGSVNDSNASRQIAVLSAGATRALLTLYSSTNSTAGQTQTAVATVSPVAYVNPMVLHARRTRVNGTSVTAGHRRGTAAEVTASANDADLTVTRFTVGASAADTAAAFAGVSIRTVVFGTGTATAASQAIWNQYGTLRGATV